MMRDRKLIRWNFALSGTAAAKGKGTRLTLGAFGDPGAECKPRCCKADVDETHEEELCALFMGAT